ncbi:MAG: peptidylprolyl isomerase [Bacteroidales bacterium]
MKISYLIIAIFLFFNGWAQELPKVKMTTGLGDILLEIDTIQAPVTAANFLDHVESGTYKDAIFIVLSEWIINPITM